MCIAFTSALGQQIQIGTPENHPSAVTITNKILANTKAKTSKTKNSEFNTKYCEIEHTLATS